MTNPELLIRPHLRNLAPYSSARDEFAGTARIYLDANENPYGVLNRYPDPHQRRLKQKLATMHGLPADTVFIGNGSDEVIDLCYRLFCIPGRDRALTFSPSYGMYRVSAAIHDVELVESRLNASFQPAWDSLLPLVEDPAFKLFFICSPNNPTGNTIEGVERILTSFRGIVVVDEAYIEFSERPSLRGLVLSHRNLVVMQTFSKAWGLASARVGIAWADPVIIQWLDRIKPPYNVSGLNQQAALDALDRREELMAQCGQIRKARTELAARLCACAVVRRVYPSDANFLLVEVSDANRIYDHLVAAGIIVRNRHSAVSNTIRITVGTPEENDQLITELSRIGE